MTLPSITNKQQEILRLLYRFRFLHRIQIQKLLKHKDYKTINLWLKDLTQKNYITRNYENTFQKRNKPAQYHIAKNGIKYFKINSIYEKKHLTKFYKESKITETFRNRCMFIADIYLQIIKHDNNVTFFTQSDFPTDGVIRDIMPSFGFIKEKVNNKYVHIVELFHEKQPRFFLRSRIKTYIEFFEDEVNTIIMFICPSDKVQKYITKFTENLLSDETFLHIPILITTEDKIENFGWHTDIWSQLQSKE